jgi:hypothetical protein
MSIDDSDFDQANDVERVGQPESPVGLEAVVLAAPAPDIPGPFSLDRHYDRLESDLNEPIRLRELLAILCLVVLCDVTIYRGEGYAGFALLFSVAPFLIYLGSRQRISLPGLIAVAVMLLAVVARLAWSGSVLQVSCGFALLIAFAMSVAGQKPFCIDAVIFVSQIIPAGLANGVRYISRLISSGGWPARLPWLNVLLPLAALLTFGFIFIFANPDFLSLVSSRAEEWARQIGQWLSSLAPWEGIFWLAVIWIGFGLMRPFVKRSIAPQQKSIARRTSDEELRTKIYPAIRNTLFTVIGLFAVYLIIEFSTLWFREFPEGFYYAGYAHEGAAWLTLALGLATIMLSVIFRGRLLNDRRLTTLKRLAWIWSAQNFLLAVAVYNRLLIYVNFNGMTPMRTIAFLGISCVVVGFLMVVYKIARQRDFLWLFQHQLLTVAIAVFVYALLPVDLLVQQYNVGQVLQGRLAPAVQIAWHDVDDWGLIALIPLTESENPEIREGVRAMLAARQAELELRMRDREKAGWTAHQVNDQRILAQLQNVSHRWRKYASDAQAQEAAYERFAQYVYQWY